MKLNKSCQVIHKQINKKNNPRCYNCYLKGNLYNHLNILTCFCSKGAVCWYNKKPMWGPIRGYQCAEPCSVFRNAQKKLPLRYKVQIWLLPLSVTRADSHVVTGNDSAPWCRHTVRPLKISYTNHVFFGIVILLLCNVYVPIAAKCLLFGNH